MLFKKQYFIFLFENMKELGYCCSFGVSCTFCKIAVLTTGVCMNTLELNRYIQMCKAYKNSVYFSLFSLR